MEVLWLVLRGEMLGKLEGGALEMDTTGDSTARGDPLMKALERFRGAALAGIVVVTDGGQNSGVPLAEVGERLKRAGVPVFAIGVGDVDARDVAIEFNSLSKTFNMTGWRVAMAVGNSEVIDALTRVKSNLDSGIPQAIQQMAITALDGPLDAVEARNKLYQRRRDRIVEVLQELGLHVDPPKAALYVWARLPSGERSSADFASRLIEETGVVITPGASYGEVGEGYVRLSLTLADDRLEEGLRRLSAFARGKQAL